jgi:hypothetical protein
MQRAGATTTFGDEQVPCAAMSLDSVFFVLVIVLVLGAGAEESSTSTMTSTITSSAQATTGYKRSDV